MGRFNYMQKDGIAPVSKALQAIKNRANRITPCDNKHDRHPEERHFTQRVDAHSFPRSALRLIYIHPPGEAPETCMS
jgi:hypothetical protein